jgi:hypothetical protein
VNATCFGTFDMGRELEVENQVIKGRAWFGYRGALWIRRATLGREGFGTVDLLLLPERGPHDLVLVEAKHDQSKDTPGRLVGQLLAYYLAARRLGSDGLERLRQFARGRDAHHARRKSLQKLSGLGRGSRHEDLKLLRGGSPLDPNRIALLVVVGSDDASAEKRESLSDLRDFLWTRAGLDIPVAIAHRKGDLEWVAQPNKPLQSTSGGMR